MDFHILQVIPVLECSFGKMERPAVALAGGRKALGPRSLQSPFGVIERIKPLQPGRYIRHPDLAPCLFRQGWRRRVESLPSGYGHAGADDRMLARTGCESQPGGRQGFSSAMLRQGDWLLGCRPSIFYPQNQRLIQLMASLAQNDPHQLCIPRFAQGSDRLHRIRK